MPAIIAGQASDPLAAHVSATQVHRPTIQDTATTKEESQWIVVAGVLTYERRIYLPAVDSLRGKVISLFHDNPESGHFGALKTTELVSRDFYWPVMDSRVRMSAAAKYATESTNRVTPGTGTTCPWRHDHGHGKASRWTSSPTCQSQRHRATPGFTLSWTDRQIWQSTYRAGRISTRRNWPRSSFNMSSASAESRIT
jgi:hypothetical protein